MKVLIVDGDPRTSSDPVRVTTSSMALHPGGLERSPFLTSVITEEGPANVELKSYDALLMLNVSRPQASRLSFFSSHRSLFSSFLEIGSSRKRTIAFHSFLENQRGGGSARKDCSRLMRSHDSLRSFSGAEGGSLRNASIRRYFKIEGSKRNLLTLENRDPLLVQADLGKANSLSILHCRSGLGMTFL